MTTEAERLRARDNAHFHFARLSVQYYVMGRVAALNHQLPVVANLLHHAVEMALKSALAHDFDLDEMKKRLSHHLPKIWKEFLARNAHLDGGEHAESIERLHRFEELRYPDSIVANGGQIDFVLLRAHVSGRPGQLQHFYSNVPKYLLILEDIDALMAFIFKATKLKLTDMMSSNSPESRSFLTTHNLHLADM